jgi:hypothetical protein
MTQKSKPKRSEKETKRQIPTGQEPLIATTIKTSKGDWRNGRTIDRIEGGKLPHRG